MALIYLSSALIAGILVGSIVYLPPALLATGLLPLSLAFILPKHRKIVIIAGMCLIAFFGGAVRYQSSLPPVDEGHIRFYNGQGTITIRGMVNQPPESGETNTHLQLNVREIKRGDSWQPVSGDALLIVSPYADYRYGDILSMTGALETPPSYEDFDYPGYLAQQGIYSTMLYPEIDTLEREQGLPPLAWVYDLRSRLSRRLTQVLPEPQASLAQGIILGIRSNIPQSVRDDFSRSGTAHLLAISGLHLAIVAGITLSLSRRLFGRRHYLYVWLTLGTIWLYALLSGLQPPVIRGAIMVSLFLTAELLGRQQRTINALALAAAIMVAVEPRILLAASFQMSFMAVAGLLFISPIIRKAGNRIIKATLDGKSTLPVWSTPPWMG